METENLILIIVDIMAILSFLYILILSIIPHGLVLNLFMLIVFILCFISAIAYGFYLDYLNNYKGRR
jgi:hypothetical protein